MKYCKGYWFYLGRTYATLHAALRAAWPGKEVTGNADQAGA